MSAIPTLTVWQPWASLIMAGFKPYEFRGWEAPRRYVGQRIAIHASAKAIRRADLEDLIVRLRSARAWTTCLKPGALEMLEKVRARPAILPLAHVLGTALLGQPIRADTLIAGFGGVINDSDRDQHSNFGWPLSAIEHLEPPEPARGALGFWMWTPGAQP